LGLFPELAHLCTVGTFGYDTGDVGFLGVETIADLIVRENMQFDTDALMYVRDLYHGDSHVWLWDRMERNRNIHGSADQLPVELIAYQQLRERFTGKLFANTFSAMRRETHGRITIDKFVQLLSAQVGYNLAPFFDAWGASEATHTVLSTAMFPSWCAAVHLHKCVAVHLLRVEATRSAVWVHYLASAMAPHAKLCFRKSPSEWRCGGEFESHSCGTQGYHPS